MPSSNELAQLSPELLLFLLIYEVIQTSGSLSERCFNGSAFSTSIFSSNSALQEKMSARIKKELFKMVFSN